MHAAHAIDSDAHCSFVPRRFKILSLSCFCEAHSALYGKTLSFCADQSHYRILDTRHLDEKGLEADPLLAQHCGALGQINEGWSIFAPF